MQQLQALLVFVHVAANLVWIGSILSVAFVLAGPAGDAKTRGALGVEIYTKLAVPAFVISFLGGSARLVTNVHYYFVETHWMHGKLAFALVVIGLHHVIGARARRMAAGQRDGPGPASTLAVILLLGATAAALFAILRPF